MGLSIDHARPPLELQLARAALLLGALQLYRFCFVVGCLAVCCRLPFSSLTCILPTLSAASKQQNSIGC